MNTIAYSVEISINMLIWCKIEIPHSSSICCWAFLKWRLWHHYDSFVDYQLCVTHIGPDWHKYGDRWANTLERFTFACNETPIFTDNFLTILHLHMCLCHRWLNKQTNGSTQTIDNHAKMLFRYSFGKITLAFCSFIIHM